MSTSGPPVDYYKVLEIPLKATQAQIREAYKKAALKHHPDRVPAGSPDRPARTKKFQQVNDAYYTLSDPTRRRDYDAARAFFPSDGVGSENDEDVDEEVPRPSAGGFNWGSFFGGTGGAAGGGAASGQQEDARRSNEQFGSVFEEMLREEGMAEGENNQPTGKFWSLVGGLSGGAMGFIVANFPGAVAGAVAGNQLGAIRDARGKSVYAVFQELPQGEKAKLLSELAVRVFAHAVGSA